MASLRDLPLPADAPALRLLLHYLDEILSRPLSRLERRRPAILRRRVLVRLALLQPQPPPSSRPAA